MPGRRLPALIRAYLRRQQVALDCVIAALLCALDLYISWYYETSDSFGRWATPLYAAVGYLPLVWRRRFPGWVFIWMWIHSLLAWFVRPDYVPSLGLWLALYTLAARASRSRAVLALLATFMHVVLNAVSNAADARPDMRVTTFLIAIIVVSMDVVAAFAVGRWAAWTAHRRRIEADEAAAEAVKEERRRIARDLHDVVAHAVSLMVLQAAGAARVLDKDPPRAAEALRHIDDLGQQAIVELRRMLGLLTESAGNPDQAVTQPLLGLRNLPGLLQRARASGRQVELRTTGDRVPLEPGVDLSAYRIVQEALTNSLRYADPHLPIRVELSWQTRKLEIRIRDHKRAAHRPARHPLSTGQGLIGMRERAIAAGGSLHAGTQLDGGYLVAADLPVTGPPPRTSAADEKEN
ncbi:histidine kinase [Streptomyces minutiscleroticus]|uniref:sensor histidine kinase n=1 Tax=Streptomyces minutiscleroticus TaxID=68238 RepID=UPI003D9F901D